MTSKKSEEESRKIKILHITYSETGGANICGIRIAEKLNQNMNLQVDVLVYEKISRKKHLIEANSWRDKVEKKLRLRNIFSQILLKLQDTHYLPPRNLGIFSSGISESIKDYDPDIIHLHWIGREMMSIKQIIALEKPIVWTLHDSWPFLATQHYLKDSKDDRFIDGYTKKNNPNKFKIDIDRWVWSHKKHFSSIKIYPVAPSKWIYDQAIQSKIFKEKRIFKINNPADENVFKFRSNYHDPLNYCSELKILFGAEEIRDNKNKGIDLIFGLADLLNSQGIKTLFNVMGKNSDYLEYPNYSEVKFSSLGYVSNEDDLCRSYHNNEIFISASEIENQSLMVIEALSCGVPVIAYEKTGSKEMITEGVNGYLFSKYTSQALFDSIIKYIEKRKFFLENNIRQSISLKAHLEYSSSTVASNYADLYKSILD